MVKITGADGKVDSPNVQRPYIISIFMSLAVMVATLLVLGLHSWSTRQHILQNAQLELHDQARISGLNIETHLSSFEQKLNFALLLPNLKEVKQGNIPSSLLDELRPLTLSDEGLVDFQVYDATGKLLVSTREGSFFTQSVADHTFFFKHQKQYQDFVIEVPLVKEPEQAAYISLSRTIPGSQNEFKGVLRLKVKLSDLQSLMIRDEFGGFDAAELFFEDGTPILSWPEDSVGRSGQENNFYQMLMDYQYSQSPEENPVSQSGIKGGHILATYKIEHYPVYIALSQTLESVLSLWFKDTITMVEVMLMIVVSILSFIFFLYRQLRIDLQREMTLRRFYVAVEQNHASIMMTDTEGNIEYVNPQFCTISGYERSEIIGHHASILSIDQNSSKTSDEIWQTISNGRKWHGEILNRKKNGDIYWELASISPVTNSEGEIINYIAVNEDISERIKIEQQLASSRDQLNEIIWGTNVGTWIWNVQTGETQFNERWAEIIGYSLEEISPISIDTWIKYVHPDDFEESQRLLKMHFAGELDFYELELRMHHKNGDWIWVLARGKVVEWTRDGLPLRASGTHTDITLRKLAENRLRVTASVFENSHEGIMITDASNFITDINPAFTRITGYSHEEVTGKNLQFLSSGRQDKNFYIGLWNDLERKGYWSGEIWNRRKSGEFYAALLSISAITEKDGTVFRKVAVFSDISHIKAQEDELRQIAHYDVLTGIPNRFLLLDRMKRAIAQSERGKKRMAVCYIDLDGFKPINDKMGHDAGDEVLIEVAKRLSNVLRDMDTVARLGGDEFVVLLLELEENNECIATIERMLRIIAQPFSIKGTAISVSVSIGVAIYPRDGNDTATLLKYADQAMYVAKHAGKNGIHFHGENRD